MFPYLRLEFMSSGSRLSESETRSAGYVALVREKRFVRAAALLNLFNFVQAGRLFERSLLINM